MTEWRADIPLAPKTTLEVGGPARYWCEAESPRAIVGALGEAQDRALPVTILGGGSNVLVSDSGVRGLVLHPTEDTVEIDGQHVRATAGVEWDRLVERCVAEGLAGLECLSGIPGHVGAAPIQNIGAYGREIGEVIHAVEVIDRQTLAPAVLSAEECQFEYRSSTFKRRARDRFVVTAVQLRLSAGGNPELRYRDLLGRFESRTPDIREVRDVVLEIRRSKSMVWDPRDPNHRSAGSFFVNPIVSSETADRADEVAGEPAPRFPTNSRDVKIPAAWLIERTGFQKGHQKGRAGISTAHALALINRGGASAREIADLAAEIQSAVRARFGVELRPEPVWLGFTDTG